MSVKAEIIEAALVLGAEVALGMHDLGDGRSVFVYENGDRLWMRTGVLHREDGPAIEMHDGTRKWYLDGKKHRDDGPAVVYHNGHTEWWFHGRKHRIGRPAVEWANGDLEWWLNGGIVRTNR
jgi:hypothetical protein